MMPFAIVIWLALTSAVIGLAVYRKLVARHEDDFLHVSEGDNARVAQQILIAGRLDAVDRWGKTLTVVAVAMGALLAGITVYQTWVESFKIKP